MSLLLGENRIGGSGKKIPPGKAERDLNYVTVKLNTYLII